MKKSTIFGAALAAMLAVPSVQAEENLLVNNFYDFNSWKNDAIIDLFVQAAEEGRMYPTKEEFEAAGFPEIELEFSRAHVHQSALLPEKKVVNTAVSDRRMWFNVPTGQGKETAGYPSGDFHSDVFTGWNYTAVHGGWNHSAYLFPGSWSSAAHKNGAQIVGGIYFFDSTYGDGGQVTKFEQHMQKFGSKNADGSYKYLDAITNLILYFGIDGIQYNMEAGTCFSSYNTTHKNFRGFWQAVRKKLKEYGVNLFCGAYQPASSISATNAQYYVGTEAEGQIFDVFLNYSASAYNYTMADSNYEYAKAAVGHGHAIYQGVWYNNLDGRGWAEMVDKKIDIVPWGEHSVSRLFEFVRGASPMELQDQYQIVTERFMSGGNQNPLNLPEMKNSGNIFQIADESYNDVQLKTWGGIASMLPERAVIKQDLPFNTYFALGNGEFYFYKGKKTNGSWYNMGQQDYVPTYRWFETPVNDMSRASDAITVKFDHRDAYIGGNSLRLINKGDAAASADVVLYRAELTVGGPVKATIAVKNGKEGQSDSHLKVLVRKKGAFNWIEIPYGTLSGSTWESKDIDVNTLKEGDVIEYVGLRVEKMPAGESIYLGQLKLDDNRTIACAPIDATSLVTDVKEEYTNLMTVRMVWSVNDAGFDCPARDRGMVFNSDVNIDHFEVFYKFGEAGKVQEVGRTSTWHALIPAIDLTKSAEDLYVGVRSVSTDLKSASPVVWQKIDRNPEAKEKFTDVYGFTYIDQGSDSWQTGCETRWFHKIKTTGASKDLDYLQETQGTFVTDPMPGYIKSDQVLEVAPGEKVEFFVKGWSGNDDIHYCIIKAYMDYDCNHDFTGADEELFTLGSLNTGTDAIVNPGMTMSVTIPADVVPGVSRLRFVASDAWKTFPGPTGGTAKGHSLDFEVKILDKGQTTRPVEATYVDLQDKGEAEDLTEEIVGIDDITLPDNTANMSVYPAVTSDVLNFTDVEKAWIYNTAGQMVKYVAAPQGAVSVAGLASGMYIVKMQNGQLVRSAKIVKK